MLHRDMQVVCHIIRASGLLAVILRYLLQPDLSWTNAEVLNFIAEFFISRTMESLPDCTFRPCVGAFTSPGTRYHIERINGV